MLSEILGAEAIVSGMCVGFIHKCKLEVYLSEDLGNQIRKFAAISSPLKYEFTVQSTGL